MRIHYDHQIFSLQDAGGASRYFYELIRNLAVYPGVELDVVMGLSNSVYPISSLTTTNIVVRRWKTELRPGIYRYAINEALENGSCLFRHSFDIYHSTLYRDLPTVSAKKTVATHHDSIHELYPDLFRNAKRIIENKKRLYGKAAAIICVSESSKRDLLRYYSVDESRVHVIYHGFSPFEIDDEAKSNRPISENYLLYVGARGSYKNFVCLLEAFAACEEARRFSLLAVGGGAMTEKESEAIDRLALRDRVHLTPKASDSYLAAAYANASLFVYPSLYEGFGFPPLEAMSLGCPVLTTYAASMPEICGDAALYYDPAVDGDLLRSLDLALRSPQNMEPLREKGFDRAASYRWPETARKTFEVYQKILQE